MSAVRPIQGWERSVHRWATGRRALVSSRLPALRLMARRQRHRGRCARRTPGRSGRGRGCRGWSAASRWRASQPAGGRHRAVGPSTGRRRWPTGACTRHSGGPGTRSGCSATMADSYRDTCGLTPPGGASRRHPPFVLAPQARPDRWQRPHSRAPLGKVRPESAGYDWRGRG